MSNEISSEKRSKIMSHIKGKETSIEIKVRKYLYLHGFRYRKNDKSLPGTPDIVITKYRAAIFVNGCFGIIITIANMQPCQKQEKIIGFLKYKEMLIMILKIIINWKN